MFTMKRFLSFAVVASMLTMLNTGCSSPSADGDKGAEKKTEQSQQEVTGDPVIEFDGGVLTVEDIQALIEKMPQQERSRYATPEGMKKLLNDLGSNAAMAQLAREKGLAEERQIEVLLMILENMRLSNEYFERYIRPEIDNLQPTDEELAAYYEANKDSFKDYVKASHILVKDEADAKEIYKELQKSPEKFEEIAKEKSTDPGSGANGGSLGWFGKGRMVPEFEKTAFALEPGQISEPVKSTFGYHIIRLEEKGTPPLDAVKQQIAGVVKQTTSRDALQAKIEAVNNEKNLVVHEDKAEKILGMEAAPGAAEGGTPPPPPPAPTPQPTTQPAPDHE